MYSLFIFCFGGKLPPLFFPSPSERVWIQLRQLIEHTLNTRKKIQTSLLIFWLDIRAQVHSRDYGDNPIYPNWQETSTTSFSNTFWIIDWLCLHESKRNSCSQWSDSNITRGETQGTRQFCTWQSRNLLCNFRLNQVKNHSVITCSVI